jgi:dihydrofolate reductase
MGRVILYIAASIDGFIAGQDGDISWLQKYEGGTEDYGYSDFYRNVGAAVMGARTFAKALSLSGGIDSKMPTYVITHKGVPDIPEARVESYSGPLSVLVQKIQGRTTKNIWLVGGGQLARSFLQEYLLDEIILSTVPVILGEGVSLFGNLSKRVDLSLLAEKAYLSGIVQSHYTIRPKD